MWDDLRELGDNTPKTLIDRIDYSGALSMKLPMGSRSRHLVIYSASGDIMCATHIREGESIMDSRVYYVVMGSLAEVRYPVAVMNAPSLGMAFKHSRGNGLDFHKSPWKSVPIPAYDRIHRVLATLAKQAEKVVEGMEFPGGQVVASKRIRGI